MTFFPWPSKTTPLHTHTKTKRRKKVLNNMMEVTQNVCFVWHTTMTHTIHGTGIFSYIYHILPLTTTIHVGKYTSPMHGMGEEKRSETRCEIVTSRFPHRFDRRGPSGTWWTWKRCGGGGCSLQGAMGAGGEPVGEGRLVKVYNREAIDRISI